jgi:uncharacterized membrane protein YbhN (UPF0104 family)
LSGRIPKVLAKVLPALVSFTLLGLGAYLLRNSLPDLLSAMKKAGMRSLVPSVLSFLVGTFLIAIRLQILFHSVGVRCGSWISFYYILVTTFASSFLHISGGSALLIAVLASADRKESFQVCLVAGGADRLIGTLAAPILAAAGFWFVFMDSETTHNATVLAAMSGGIVIGGLLVGVLLSGSEKLQGILMRLFRKVGLEKLAEASMVLLQSRKTLFYSVLLTLVVFFFYSLSAYYLALPLDSKAPLGIFLALVPALSIATALPSIGGGLGVREAVFCLFLGPYQPLEEAVAVSFLFYGVTLIVSVFGGIVMAFRGWPNLEIVREEGRRVPPAAEDE